MRFRDISGSTTILGLVVAIGTVFAAAPAEASGRHGAYRGRNAGHGHAAAYNTRGGGGLQCVPFARENTGIELAGNAATWWSNAQGIYERGARPEVGSVLNFRANGHMRMGHVAVVSNVIDGRNIEIDHANWAGPGAGRGSITRNINVVDVSPENDWSAVRVALGHSADFGSVYPTYGFIYDRPDRGTMVANNTITAAPVLNAAPRDLRPAVDRIQFAAAPQEIEEVAEAEDDTQPSLRRGSFRHGMSRIATASSSRASYATVSRVSYGNASRAGYGASSRANYANTSRSGYAPVRGTVSLAGAHTLATHGRTTAAPGRSVATARTPSAASVTRTQSHAAPAAHHGSKHRT